MTIHRELLNEDDRINHTADLFGDTHYPFVLEPFIFNMAGRMSRDYTGGYWHFYERDNCGFYMAPDSDKLFLVSCMNGYEGKLSADAFGITVCLHTYSNLSFSDNPELAKTCAEQYHLLSEFALDHHEARGIMAAID